MSTNFPPLNVMLFPQTNGNHQVWVAQCIDLDIAAQGNSVEEAQESFSNTILAHVALCVRDKVEPFANIPAAPAWFARDFDNMPTEPTVKPLPSTGDRARIVFKHALAAA